MGLPLRRTAHQQTPSQKRPAQRQGRQRSHSRLQGQRRRVRPKLGEMVAEIEIIAHRGASRDAPENTLAAVNLAWRQGADAAEVDVQFSRDGKLVVIHDPNTRRTAKRNKKVSDQTLAELRLLDVGRWKGDQWRGERIPTLEEVLETVPNGKRRVVELKAAPNAIPKFSQLPRNAPKSQRRSSPSVS